jgi:hypothetical protein
VLTKLTLASKDKIELATLYQSNWEMEQMQTTLGCRSFLIRFLRVCWDNYAAIGKVTADKLGIKDGDVVKSIWQKLHY